jgi:hypothetical protein
VIADQTIVRDVAVSQNVIVRTDARDFTVARRAVDGGVFTESIMVADLRARDAAFPFQILRPQTDAGERKNLVLLPKRRVAVNDDM